jgi:serine protease SohB
MAEQNMFEHLQQLFASARAALRPILPKWLRGGVPIVPVVRLAGVIGFSTPLKPGLTLATVARPLERAFKMRHARAVALLINSPGGSPVQSHLIYRRIRQLAAENTRPVMVVGSSFGFPKLMEKLGVERRLYVSGEHKAMLDPFLPEKAEDVERLKALQQEIHQDFIGLVKRSRGARLKGPEKTLFSGEYWSGSKAVGLGLADGIGDLRTTLRTRFGDDVVTPLVAPARGWFGRLQPGVGTTDLDGLPRAADFAEEVISALETRALWARYGL